jgi:hypothetical protein
MSSKSIDEIYPAFFFGSLFKRLLNRGDTTSLASSFKSFSDCEIVSLAEVLTFDDYWIQIFEKDSESGLPQSSYGEEQLQSLGLGSFNSSSSSLSDTSEQL